MLIRVSGQRCAMAAAAARPAMNRPQTRGRTVNQLADLPQRRRARIDGSGRSTPSVESAEPLPASGEPEGPSPATPSSGSMKLRSDPSRGLMMRVGVTGTLRVLAGSSGTFSTPSAQIAPLPRRLKMNRSVRQHVRRGALPHARTRNHRAAWRYTKCQADATLCSTRSSAAPPCDRPRHHPAAARPRRGDSR